MAYRYVIQSLRLKDPREELLAYDYSRVKTLKCLRKLSGVIVPLQSADELAVKLNNHILLIRDKGQDPTQYLQQLFHEDVDLETNDLENLFRRSQETDAAISFPREAFLTNRLCLVVIETAKDIMGRSCLSNDDEMLLELLYETFPNKDLRIMRFLTICTTKEERAYIEKSIKDQLHLKAHEFVNVHNAMDALKDCRTFLHNMIGNIIDEIEGEMQEMRVDVSSRESANRPPSESDSDALKLQAIDRVSSVFADLKRTLGKSQPKRVGIELLGEFKRMERKGYVGYVLIHEKLIIYFEQDTKESQMDRLNKTALKYFDTVSCCKVDSKSRMKEFTRLEADTRAKNESSRSGRIGAIAKLDDAGALAALTVPHFAKDGDVVKVDDEIIGKGIWPPSEGSDRLINEISVIKVKEDRRNDCSLQHDSMNCEKRLFNVHADIPPTYSKVYRGRMDTGFMTGRILTTDAYLPLADTQMHSFLVEGDDEMPFATEGDSGSIVKLQKERNETLRGVSMVYGGADKLPNIEEDTCLTIPLYSAINSFETRTGHRLFFQ